MPPSAAHDTESTGWIARQAPGYYRMALGDFRITVLSDGTAMRNVAEIMSRPDVVRQEFAASHQALPTELSVNCFLVDTGEHRILVDTGAGELFGPDAGRLLENLKAAGYLPEAIDVIALTHIHGDHSGGLSMGGRRVFPHAVVHVDKRDPEFWLDAVTAARAPSNRQRTFEQSRQTVGPYVDAGKLRPFDGAGPLYPGIRVVPEPGHTPGMVAYMVESRGERLLLWGDIIHAAEVQMRVPGVTIDYDVDPDGAVATRERILCEAAEQGYLIGASHISFPGLGHVRAEVSGYSWVPLPYSTSP